MEKYRSIVVDAPFFIKENYIPPGTVVTVPGGWTADEWANFQAGALALPVGATIAADIESDISHPRHTGNTYVKDDRLVPIVETQQSARHGRFGTDVPTKDALKAYSARALLYAQPDELADAASYSTAADALSNREGPRMSREEAQRKIEGAIRNRWLPESISDTDDGAAMRSIKQLYNVVPDAGAGALVAGEELLGLGTNLHIPGAQRMRDAAADQWGDLTERTTTGGLDSIERTAAPWAGYLLATLAGGAKGAGAASKAVTMPMSRIGATGLKNSAARRIATGAAMGAAFPVIDAADQDEFSVPAFVGGAVLGGMAPALSLGASKVAKWLGEKVSRKTGLPVKESIMGMLETKPAPKLSRQDGASTWRAILEDSKKAKVAPGELMGSNLDAFFHRLPDAKKETISAAQEILDRESMDRIVSGAFPDLANRTTNEISKKVDQEAEKIWSNAKKTPVATLPQIDKGLANSSFAMKELKTAIAQQTLSDNKRVSALFKKLAQQNDFDNLSEKPLTVQELADVVRSLRDGPEVSIKLAKGLETPELKSVNKITAAEFKKKIRADARDQLSEKSVKHITSNPDRVADDISEKAASRFTKKDDVDELRANIASGIQGELKRVPLEAPPAIMRVVRQQPLGSEIPNSLLDISVRAANDKKLKNPIPLSIPSGAERRLKDLEDMHEAEQRSENLANAALINLLMSLGMTGGKGDMKANHKDRR